MKNCLSSDNKYYANPDDCCSKKSGSTSSRPEVYLGEKLRSAGMKSTRLSSEIYNFLLGNKKPADAETIYRFLRQKANLSSVYRVLKKLLHIGLIFEEKIEGTSYYYYAEKHHHHIKCVKCGCIKCVECSVDFSGLIDFTHITHELSLKGLCSDCFKK